MKFLIALILISSSAWAGAESHGGQALQCPGKETVMLDYYQATIPTMGGAPELMDISGMTADQMLDRLHMGLSYSLLFDPFQRTLDILGKVSTWLEASLVTVPDADPAFEVPEGCRLIQVAVRQDDVMYLDPEAYKLLSPAQQGILRAHEALYYIAEKNGKDSSVEVRMVIRNLLMKNINRGELAKSVRNLGSQFFFWEDYLGTYHNSSSGPVFISMSLNYDPVHMSDFFEIQFNQFSIKPLIEPLREIVRCTDAQTCETLVGPVHCSLLNFSGGSPALDAGQNLELKCDKSQFGDAFDVIVR